MKALYTLSMLSVLCVGFATGCETSHEESTSRNPITGSVKHEDTTVTKNPITGDTSVQHSQQKVNP